MFIYRRALSVLSLVLLAACTADAVDEGDLPNEATEPNVEDGTRAPNPPAQEPMVPTPTPIGDAGAAGEPNEPYVDTECVSCSEHYNGAEAVMCKHDQDIYLEYVGCMCSGPCAEACGETNDACSMTPSEVTQECRTCLATQTIECSEKRSLCLDTQRL